MTEPFGFVGPVVGPTVGGAANTIVPLLIGPAGAVAGAKAGAVLGPKGILAGAILGGLLGPLLFPDPLAPGTMPAGLDPGLNSPEPAPEPGPAPTPSGTYPMPDPPDLVGVSKTYAISYSRIWYGANYRQCSSGDIITPSTGWRDMGEDIRGFVAKSFSLVFQESKEVFYCGSGNNINEKMRTLYAIADAGLSSERELGIRQDNYIEFYTEGASYHETPNRFGVRLNWLSINGEPQPLPVPVPEPPVKPRPQPIPIPPLPQPEPVPEPAPQPVPQPEPVIVPSPNTPKAPPVVIPNVPKPAPQPVPKPQPTPIVTPQPQPAPQPPVPAPVPGAPPVPEPQPQPEPKPVPGPVPPPTPLPPVTPEPPPEVPDPNTPKQPPGPLPPPIPIPTPVVPEVPLPGEAPAPIVVQPTLPDGEVAPLPQPAPLPTPPDNHFPIPGGPPVNTGQIRGDIAAVAKEVGRIEQKIAQSMNGGMLPPNQLLDLIQLLMSMLQSPVPADTYTLTGVCEAVDDEGNQPVFSTPLGEKPAMEAIVDRLDAMQYLFQAHLGYKTPTCSGTRPVLEGRWVTVNWQSIEPSSDSPLRLRKRSRYRTKSGRSNSELIDYFKDFSWQAGPVCVQHADAWWGTPQVWASDGDEGKRVIRHLAGEAGLDPDQVGRWILSSSRNPRFGMSGTMIIRRIEGIPWVTSREGSNMLPLGDFDP